jgi:hypothetical protein
MSTLSRLAGITILALMLALAVSGVAWGVTTIR